MGNGIWQIFSCDDLAGIHVVNVRNTIRRPTQSTTISWRNLWSLLGSVCARVANYRRSFDIYPWYWPRSVNLAVEGPTTILRRLFTAPLSCVWCFSFVWFFFSFCVQPKANIFSHFFLCYANNIIVSIRRVLAQFLDTRDDSNHRRCKRKLFSSHEILGLKTDEDDICVLRW